MASSDKVLAAQTWRPKVNPQYLAKVDGENRCHKAGF